MKISIRDRMIAARRFANRLAKDVAGNTLAIVGAAIIPLAALVGSGIDMSRAYMAQARLQMACDAASLAGRRAMTTGAVDATVRSEALKFFRFNFETGETGRTPAFNVASFTPTVDDGANSAVVVSASTTVPTTLMSMFGYTQVPISVNCNARQDFVNTDIVLVLDTTGSMSSDTSGNEQNSGPTSKIAGMRSAVLALYDELAPAQTQLESVGLRLRYGIVPYSVTVNVGKLIRAQSTGYMASTWPYQTRRPAYYANAVSTDSSLSASSSGGPSGSGTVTCYRAYRNNSTSGTSNSCVSTASAAASQTGTNISNSRCTSFGSNAAFNNSSGNNFSPSPAGNPVTVEALPGVYRVTFSRETSTYSTDQKCVRKEIWEPHDRITQDSGALSTPSGYTFYGWEYTQVTRDVSGYLGGSATTLPTETNGSTSTWRGCIEERSTDGTINSSSTAATDDAHDLNIDEIPTNDQTRWGPHWPEVVYRRNSIGVGQTANASTGTAMTSTGTNYWACPAEAKRLQAWTKADLTTYLNTLYASGYTYHDIGMIWGAHFISSGGIFAGDNPTTYKNMPVAKYIIYLTDGQLDTEPGAYTAYGVEYLDQRASGTYASTSDLDSRHKKRFSLACDAAKSVGANIWVISFATSLSTELTNCASKTTQAKVSSSSAALIQDFAKIGKEIGALRLTK
jgi:Flp pilus assembly protein TadG